MITITKNSYELHEDIDAQLFNHDFEFSMYQPNEIEEYIEDFLDTNDITWATIKRGDEKIYLFNLKEFCGKLEMKYDNDDNLDY